MEKNIKKMMCMDSIISDINSNLYKIDDRIPSDWELAQAFDLPRLDVRNIFSNLEAMDYIYSVRGIGRFLKKETEKIEFDFYGGDGFTAKLAKKGIVVGTINRNWYNGEEDIKTCNRLGIGKNIEFHKLVRIRYVGETPIACHISYLRKDIFKELDIEEIDGLKNYYEKFGVINTIEKDIEITSEYANEEIRQALECRELTPIIKTENIVVDKDRNLPIEFTRIFYRGDRFKFKI